MPSSPNTVALRCRRGAHATVPPLVPSFLTRHETVAVAIPPSSLTRRGGARDGLYDVSIDSLAGRQRVQVSVHSGGVREDGGIATSANGGLPSPPLSSYSAVVVFDESLKVCVPWPRLYCVCVLIRLGR